MTSFLRLNKLKNITIFPDIMKAPIPNCYVLKFDGCSKGNPSLAGAGAVLYYDNKEISSFSEFIGTDLTNNQAQYHGLILGLKNAIKWNVPSLYVYGDSQLVINQMNSKNVASSPDILPLYEEVKALESNFANIKYEHIYRVENMRADELANLAIYNKLSLPKI